MTIFADAVGRKEIQTIAIGASDHLGVRWTISATVSYLEAVTTYVWKGYSIHWVYASRSEKKKKLKFMKY